MKKNYLWPLIVVALLAVAAIYSTIRKNPYYTRVTIVVMSVERVSQSKNIFDINKTDFFQVNTTKEIKLSDGSICQAFAVMDESRGAPQTYVFKNLYSSGRQYWGTFKAEVELSTNPELISYYKNMPVLVQVIKIIEPAPPEQ